MRLKLAGLCLFLLGMTTLNVSAQTLFQYGKHKVSKKEFVAALEKNRTVEGEITEQEVNDYLELYALFKMRLQNGYDTKINEEQSFKEEYNTYKNQLVNSFVYDRAIEERLLKEAIQRSKEERQFAHILLPISKPQDSAEVAKQIHNIYQDIQSGKISFEDAARKYSKDQGSASKGGRVGYIGPVTVVYDVENIVYQTSKGEVSKPFHSPFGIHLVKVLDVRPASGEVQVAQILISKSEGKPLAENVLEQLTQGADFSELVTMYSKDAFSVENGGILEPFGVGRMQEDFENAAFSLKKPGDLSGIVETEYGFHILKLITKHAPVKGEELETVLKAEIQKDGRSRTVRNQMLDEILSNYQYQPHETNLNQFRGGFIKGTSNEFELSNYTTNDNVLFQLNKQSYTVADFMTHVYEKTNGRIFGSRLNFFNQMYKGFTEQLVLDLETQRLQKSNAEFQELLNEYEQGMVIFNVMEKNVWGKSNQDVEMLQAYYNQHKNNYKFGPGFEGVVYTGERKQYLVELKNMLEAGSDFQKALNTIDAARGIVKFKRDIGKFDYADYPNIGIANLSSGQFSEIFPDEDEHFKMIYVSKHYNDIETLAFDEVKGRVSVDYQKSIEEEWNKILKATYPLKVKKRVLKSIY